jgi:DUF1009 family protein
MDKIGLIAGNRKFPLIFAESAKKNNFSVVAVAIKGETSPQLKKIVNKIYWLGLGEFGKVAGIFKSEGVKKVVMAGQISPRRLFSKEVRDNPELQGLLSSIQDKKAGSIFTAIIKRLEDSGLELLDSTTFLEEFIPKAGTLTRREPGFDEWEDIYFGLNLARQIAHLDIGQTVAVKNKAIIAVEALEGTDNLIRRAGNIARGRMTVVKVSRPDQDMRFDIPVIGLNTIKNIIKAGTTCLAIEAGKTLFIDKEQGVKLADRNGVAIVAV